MVRSACIAAIEYYLPATALSNEELARDFPEWSVDKIYQKTGIATRPVVSGTECSSDLAVAAARKLFASGVVSESEIDYVILCTQSPDYFLPATACLVQEALSLPTSCGAIDVNQGCSGYIYSLGLAKGLIESQQASKVLVITAETYSKFIHPKDKSVRTLFGDAAAATLVVAKEQAAPAMHSFVYGTDGAGAENLIVPAGGARRAVDAEALVEREDESGNVRTDANLYMNGPEIFAFTLRAVPALISAVLSKANLAAEEIDVFVPHQANKFMLDTLVRKSGFPDSKMLRAYEEVGNTVSCTIPIALKMAAEDGRLKPGQRLLLAGFGVGYSWGGCVIEGFPQAVGER